MITRRHVLLGASSAVLCASGIARADAETLVGNGLRLKTTDFAKDRAAFKTSLLYRGTSPQAPHALPACPPTAKELTYVSSGLALKAWYTLPKSNNAKLPVVIFLHGGFAFEAEDFDMALPFVDAGYAIVTPILRGEDGQPGNYSMFYDEIDDILAVAAHVRSLPWADADHIYLAGHSVGGTHAMLAGQASPLFRAVASFSGSPDQIAFTSGETWSRIVPFDRKNRMEYELRSPLAYARSFKSPPRLYYGTEEAFFQVTTPQTAAIAREAGLDVEAVAVPGNHFGAVPGEIALAIAFFRSKA